MPTRTLTPAGARVEGGQEGRSVGLREVPFWSAVERVDVRCRFKTGPVEEVWLRRIARMGLTMPRSIHCATLRLNINDVRWKDPRIAPQLFLCPARFRLSFALRTAERSTDQLTPPRRSLSFPYYRHLSLPERPMKIEVVVDPSRLAPTPSLASRVAPAENTAVVTNGTQAARSVAVALQVSAG